LVENEMLEAAGVIFTPVNDLRREIEESEFGGRTYRLECNGHVDIPQIDEETLAQAIAPGEDAVAVTFSVECADEFPSIALLAPGNPLLGQLVSTVREASEASNRLACERRPDDPDNPRSLVCGRGRNGTLAILGDGGSVEEDRSIAVIDSWYNAFVDNHEKATQTSEPSR
jgi:hypothetical protein